MPASRLLRLQWHCRRRRATLARIDLFDHLDVFEADPIPAISHGRAPRALTQLAHQPRMLESCFEAGSDILSIQFDLMTVYSVAEVILDPADRRCKHRERANHRLHADQ